MQQLQLNQSANQSANERREYHEAAAVVAVYFCSGSSYYHFLRTFLGAFLHTKLPKRNQSTRSCFYVQSQTNVRAKQTSRRRSHTHPPPKKWSLPSQNAVRVPTGYITKPGSSSHQATPQQSTTKAATCCIDNTLQLQRKDCMQYVQNDQRSYHLG